MLKRIYISFLLLFSLNQLIAQGNYTRLALDAYQKTDWTTAFKYIDSAIVAAEEVNDPFTWHLRGFIYKDYFKQVEKENRNSAYRQVAIDAYMRSSELDKTGDFKPKNTTNLNYLVISLYNDAVRLLQDTTNYSQSEKYFIQYKTQLLRAYPDTSLRAKDIEYYNAYATVLVKKYNRMDRRSEEFFNMAINVYEKVVDLDSNNCLAHYMIGILYYNKGVDIILNLDPDTPLDQIVKAQDECLELFLKSKPHMYKAWDLQDCKNIDPLEIAEGLSGIHYQLNEPDKHKYWEDLKKKIREGNK